MKLTRRRESSTSTLPDFFPITLSITCPPTIPSTCPPTIPSTLSPVFPRTLPPTIPNTFRRTFPINLSRFIGKLLSSNFYKFFVFNFLISLVYANIIQTYEYQERIKSIPRRFQSFENEISPISFERKFFKDNSPLNHNRAMHGEINEWFPKN